MAAGRDSLLPVVGAIWRLSAPLARVLTAITTESGYRAWCSQDTEFDGKQATFRFAVRCGWAEARRP